MGGRGSAFLDNYNPNHYSTIDNIMLQQISSNALNDDDTKLEHEGRTQLLKNKKIHIKQSTDKITEEILIPNADKINDLSNKYEYSCIALINKNEELRIRADEMPSSYDAMFVHSGNDFNNLQLVYNKDYSFYTKDRLENNTKKQIKMGYWTHSDDNQLVNHTVTHEYGHYIQQVLMEKDSNTKEGKLLKEQVYNKMNEAKHQKELQKIISTYNENYAQKYLKSIQRIARKEYGRDYENQKISDYADTNDRETFAELFCNLNTNKNTNNDYVKAMEIYLERRLK